MAASSLLATLNLFENSNLREINSFWTGTLNRIWKLQKFVRDKFTLSRILNRIWELQKFVRDKFTLGRILNRIWELQCFVGERCLLNRILNQSPYFEPEIFWRLLNFHRSSSNLRGQVIFPSMILNLLKPANFAESYHCSPRVSRRLEELAWDSP